jgi:hypothetical protein
MSYQIGCRRHKNVARPAITPSAARARGRLEGNSMTMDDQDFPASRAAFICFRRSQIAHEYSAWEISTWPRLPQDVERDLREKR